MRAPYFYPTTGCPTSIPHSERVREVITLHTCQRPPLNYHESTKRGFYTEIIKGDEEIEFYSQRYKQDMKELMKQVVFFRTLLEREAASEYLSQNYPQMVKDVQKILARSETEVLS